METKLKTFVKNVAALATPESLTATRTMARGCKIKARATNTQAVSIGNGTNQDYPLAAGQELDVGAMGIGANGRTSDVDLSSIFVKVGVNGEGVHVIYNDPTLTY